MGPTKSVLTPDLCRTFVALIRLGGAPKAVAEELGLDEASISKRLRPLVRGRPPELPRPWLVKTGRKFGLTDEGRRMLPAAEEQADRWAAFADTAAADRAAGVTVACGHEAAGGVVLAAAARFRALHPDAALRVAVVRGRQRVEGVVSGRYDLAVVTDNPAAVKEAARRPVAVEQLPDDELVLACAARGPWAAAFADGARPADARDVAGWPLVLPEGDAAIRRRWDELLRRRDPSVVPVAAVEVGGWQVLLGYVLAGFGVGLVPRSVAAAAGAKVRVRALVGAIRPANRPAVVWLPNRPDARLADAFRAALTEAAPPQ